MKYRILEIEGITNWICEHENKKLCDDKCIKIEMTGKYIPKYIVQENHVAFDPAKDSSVHWEWANIKEFNNLEEARKYKRELELKNGGIVIE